MGEPTVECGLCDPPARVDADSVGDHLREHHAARFASLAAAGRPTVQVKDGSEEDDGDAPV